MTKSCAERLSTGIYMQCSQKYVHHCLQTVNVNQRKPIGLDSSAADVKL